jgi:hypothetical protein
MPASKKAAATTSIAFLITPLFIDSPASGWAAKDDSRLRGALPKGGAGNDRTSRLSQGRRRQRHLLLLRLVARTPSAILDRLSLLALT